MPTKTELISTLTEKIPDAVAFRIARYMLIRADSNLQITVSMHHLIVTLELDPYELGRHIDWLERYKVIHIKRESNKDNFYTFLL